MSFRIEIEAKLQEALKERNKLKISTLRLILAAIKDRDIATRTSDNRAGIKDEDIKQLLKKMIKQRNESIEIYKKNNRSDLLEVEQNEYDILSSFLPKQLNEEDTKKICEEIIAKVGANSVKDMGKVMAALKTQYAGKLDMARASAVVKEKLG